MCGVWLCFCSFGGVRGTGSHIFKCEGLFLILCSIFLAPCSCFMETRYSIFLNFWRFWFLIKKKKNLSIVKILFIMRSSQLFAFCAAEFPHMVDYPWLVCSCFLLNMHIAGAWVAQWIKSPALGFVSGHDLMVHGFESCVFLWANVSEPGACFRRFVSLSLSLPLSCLCVRTLSPLSLFSQK